MSARLREHLARNPDQVYELYLLASEIVDDFEDYGPVLQANIDGEYDGTTVIGRLREIRNELLSSMRAGN